MKSDVDPIFITLPRRVAVPPNPEVVPSIDVPVAPLPPPPVNVTVGGLLYPLPLLVITTESTSLLPLITAYPAAPLPPPPVNVTVGADS